MSNNCECCEAMVAGCVRKQYSQFNKVLDKYGSELVTQFESNTRFSYKNFTFGKTIHRKFDKLSCMELILVACAFEYVGANDRDDFVDFSLSFFRHSEFNIARQLQLFMLESLKYGSVNDHLYAYKDKYTVYGYLYFTPNIKNQYTFLIRDFYVNDLIKMNVDDYSKLNKIIRKKLVKFRKLCTRIGINNVEIEPHLYSDDDEIYSMLVSDGFITTRHEMMWVKP